MLSPGQKPLHLHYSYIRYDPRLLELCHLDLPKIFRVPTAKWSSSSPYIDSVSTSVSHAKLYEEHVSKPLLYARNNDSNLSSLVRVVLKRQRTQREDASCKLSHTAPSRSTITHRFRAYFFSSGANLYDSFARHDLTSVHYIAFDLTLLL